MRPKPRPGPRTLLALLAVLALSGCAGPGRPAATLDPSASATDVTEGSGDFGRFKGLVLSDEQLPIPAARVEVVGSILYGVTDLEGRYAIADVLPGSYELEVRVGQNPPVRREASVQAGETVTVDFQVTLERPIVEEPYHVTQIVQGRMSCNVAAQACPGYPAMNDKQDFDHLLEGRPVALLYELTRDSTLPPAPAGLGETNQPGWIRRWDFVAESNVAAYGSSAPPYMRTNVSVPKSITVESPVRVHVETHGVGFLQNPGIAYEEAFTVYMTAFHLRDDSGTLCAAPPDLCPAPQS